MVNPRIHLPLCEDIEGISEDFLGFEQTSAVVDHVHGQAVVCHTVQDPRPPPCAQIHLASRGLVRGVNSTVEACGRAVANLFKSML